MIIRLSHDAGSVTYQASNQYNMVLRSVKFYRARIDGDDHSVSISFRNASDCHDWLDKYLLEFAELQAYLMKYHGLKSLEIYPNAA